MYALPVMIKSYPDETLYSWMYRTMKANALSSYTFLNTCLGKSDAYAPVRYLTLRTEFVSFCHNAGLDKYMKNLFWNLSTYSFELIGMSPEYQTKVLNSVLRSTDKLNPPYSLYFPLSNICPQCIKEDTKKYSEPYFHRAHQLSGVAVCHKHGEPLLKLTNRMWGELKITPDNTVLIESSASTDDALAYAQYANEILMAGINTDGNDVRKIILDGMNGLGFNIRNDTEKIADIMNAWEHSSLFDEDAFNKRISKRIYYGKNMNVKDTVPLIMYFYPDASEFITKLPEHEDIIEQYTCPACGEVYCATPWSQENGWGCPKCDSKKSEQERFENVIHTISGGKYQVKGEVKNLLEPACLHHETCGKDITITPKSFIFGRHRCSCEQKLSRAEAEKKMEKHSDFKLIEYFGSNDPATIYHKKCGQTFRIPFIRFIGYPHCQVCEPSVASVDNLQRRVKELVGDEYTVTGIRRENAKKVTIIHNKCGKEHTYSLGQFFIGQRCPYCRTRLYTEDLKGLLKIFSHGRYKIVERENKMCNVLDTQTGNNIWMDRQRLAQEMSRVTPSPLLPLDFKHEPVVITPYWDKMFQEFLDYKEKFHTAYVPASSYSDDNALAEWCALQRDQWRKGTLPERHERLLNESGFVFDVMEYFWHGWYSLYKEYISEKGLQYVAYAEKYKNRKLGSWLWRQRHKQKDGKLSKEHEKLLLEINPEMFE